MFINFYLFFWQKYLYLIFPIVEGDIIDLILFLGIHLIFIGLSLQYIKAKKNVRSFIPLPRLEELKGRVAVNIVNPHDDSLEN